MFVHRLRVDQSRFHCILVNVRLTVSAMPLSDINLVAGKRTFIPDYHYDSDEALVNQTDKEIPFT